jgi:hypothetical protein
LKAAHIYVRLIGLLSFIVGIAIVYDLSGRSLESDSAVVTGKAQFFGRYGSSNMVYAKGRYVYSEDVALRFYNTCQVGDILELRLTPLAKEWRHVVLFRNGSDIAHTIGSDIWFMGLFGVVFLSVAGLSSFGPSSFTCKLGFLIGSSFINLLALVLCLKYLGVLAGAFEKM